MGQIIMRNWDIREYHVQVNSPCAIQQIAVLIQHVISLSWGVPNSIRHVLSLISHIHLYSPHGSHHHPVSYSVSSTTLPSSDDTKLSHSSVSPYVMIMRWHWVQHTPSTAYTEYSIQGVQHTPSTTYTKYSIHPVQHTPSTAYTQYSVYRVQCIPNTTFTQDSLSSLLFHGDVLAPDCSLSFRRASQHNQPPSAHSPWQLRVQFRLQHLHGCKLNAWCNESQHPVLHPMTASKYVSKLAVLRPTCCAKYGPHGRLYTC
jgi:hypothetical protein